MTKKKPMSGGLKQLDAFVENLSNGKGQKIRKKFSAPKATFGELPRLRSCDHGLLPNAFSMSSLFVPLSRKSVRPVHNRTELAHLWETCRFLYTGEQMDESDRDVLIALMILGNGTRPGDVFTFRRLQLLKLVRPNTKKFSNQAYQWLEDSLCRLLEATMYFEQTLKNGSTFSIGKRLTGIHILRTIHIDEETNLVSVCFEPFLADFFFNQQYSFISLKARASLSSHLAKSLQALFSTAKEKTQKYRFDWLREKHQYVDRNHKVQKRLTAACEEMVEKGLLESYEWVTNRRNELFLQIDKGNDVTLDEEGEASSLDT